MRGVGEQVKKRQEASRMRGVFGAPGQDWRGRRDTQEVYIGVGSLACDSGQAAESSNCEREGVFEYRE